MGFNVAKKEDPFYRLIMGGYIDQYWNIFDSKMGNMNFSNEFKDLYISMVAPDENNRPHIAQILIHPWLNEINNLDNQQLHQLEVDVRNAFIEREKAIINRRKKEITLDNEDDTNHQDNK